MCPSSPAADRERAESERGRHRVTTSSSLAGVPHRHGAQAGFRFFICPFVDMKEAVPTKESSSGVSHVDIYRHGYH